MWRKETDGKRKEFEKIRKLTSSSFSFCSSVKSPTWPVPPAPATLDSVLFSSASSDIFEKDKMYYDLWMYWWSEVEWTNVRWPNLGDEKWQRFRSGGLHKRGVIKWWPGKKMKNHDSSLLKGFEGKTIVVGFVLTNKTEGRKIVERKDFLSISFPMIPKTSPENITSSIISHFAIFFWNPIGEKNERKRKSIWVSHCES